VPILWSQDDRAYPQAPPTKEPLDRSTAGNVEMQEVQPPGDVCSWQGDPAFRNRDGQPVAIREGRRPLRAQRIAPDEGCRLGNLRLDLTPGSSQRIHMFSKIIEAGELPQQHHVATN